MCKDKEVKLHLFLTSEVVTVKLVTLPIAKIVYSSLAFRGFLLRGFTRLTGRNISLGPHSIDTSVRTVQQLEMVFEPNGMIFKELKERKNQFCK